jgi:zinc transporter ZupT
VSFPWYIQPIVAVPAFLCADAFQKVLPFCTGFAAGCMIWIVIAEVLPDAFKVTNVWLSRKSKLLNLLFLNDSILQF